MLSLGEGEGGVAAAPSSGGAAAEAAAAQASASALACGDVSHDWKRTTRRSASLHSASSLSAYIRAHCVGPIRSAGGRTDGPVGATAQAECAVASDEAGSSADSTAPDGQSEAMASMSATPRSKSDLATAPTTSAADSDAEPSLAPSGQAESDQPDPPRAAAPRLLAWSRIFPTVRRHDAAASNADWLSAKTAERRAFVGGVTGVGGMGSVVGGGEASASQPVHAPTTDESSAAAQAKAAEW
jgi:hypothetical protein